ncbi:MAG: DUF3053 family protein [Candidatus Malihini olakiniferum]
MLTTFSQQLRQSMAVSLKLLLERVSQICVPQDYLTQRDGVRSAVGAINLLEKQMQTAKTQADSARRKLSQLQEMQVLYEHVYSQVVVQQPAAALGNVVPVRRHAGLAALHRWATFFILRVSRSLLWVIRCNLKRRSRPRVTTH